MEWIGNGSDSQSRDRVRCAAQGKNDRESRWKRERMGRAAGWLGQKVRHRQTHTQREKERVYRVCLSSLAVLGGDSGHLKAELRIDDPDPRRQHLGSVILGGEWYMVNGNISKVGQSNQSISKYNKLT